MSDPTGTTAPDEREASIRGAIHNECCSMYHHTGRDDELCTKAARAVLAALPSGDSPSDGGHCARHASFDEGCQWCLTARSDLRRAQGYAALSGDSPSDERRPVYGSAEEMFAALDSMNRQTRLEAAARKCAQIKVERDEALAALAAAEAERDRLRETVERVRRDATRAGLHYVADVLDAALADGDSKEEKP